MPGEVEMQVLLQVHVDVGRIAFLTSVELRASRRKRSPAVWSL